MRSIIFFSFLAIFVVFCSAKVAARDQKCLEPIVSGRCDAYLPRFGYDPEKNECVQFVYGGCGGNGNNFSLKEDCEKACKA